MSKPKFTPGPWFVRKHAGKFVRIENLVGTTAIASINYEIGDESEANAKLIEVSPELYEASEAALECLQNNGFGKAYVEDLLKAVLAKARVVA